MSVLQKKKKNIFVSHIDMKKLKNLIFEFKFQ